MKSIAEIAAQLQGYDPHALPAPLVGEFLARLVQPLTEQEEVPLADACGRVLAQDVISPFSVPPHDNSAMDGYAFDGAALAAGQRLQLEVVGTAFAGQAWRGQVGPGQCLKIMTGAIMPPGLDTVVPQEFTQASGERQVSVPAGLLRPGDNRRRRGEDLQQGQPALRRGTRLSPAACGLLASLGLPAVPVVRRPRVAYFSTGDEILSLGQPPREGAVYDSNRFTVRALLARLGCEVDDLGVVPDDPMQLERAFADAAARADAVITSGGVSVGEADHTQAMMARLGDVAFWRVAMRPGRPMAVGRMARTVPARFAAGPPQGKTAPSGGSEPREAGSVGAILFGLPGNPVAVMVTFLAFVRPALLRMMGSAEGPLPMLRARSTEALRKKPGRTEYQRGIVGSAADGRLQVRTTGNQGSGVLSSMVQANGLIVLHHGQGDVAAGDEVDVMMFEGVA